MLKKVIFFARGVSLSKLVITFVCENRHDVETVTFDLNRCGEIPPEEIWQLLRKGCRCNKCGSDKFTYRTRYKEYMR